MMRKIPPITSEDRKRLIWLTIGVFAFFSLLIVQFYKIQILEGEKWSRVAYKQHFFTVKEPFLRGTFFSNTATKRLHPESPQRFVIDIQKFHLYADPLSIPLRYRKEIADCLFNFLRFPEEEQECLYHHFGRKSRSRKLAMWLDKELRDNIMQWWLPYARRNRIPRNALFFVSDYQRSYPFGKLLGQVLHTVQHHKDEATMRAVPTGGLELYFNEYLQGKQGQRRLMRSPRNSFEMGEVIDPPQNGADVYLTVNHYLQAIAEEEIAIGVKNANAKGGRAVMMDPRTGEILALAQYPFFYPAEYQNYFCDPEQVDHTRVQAITDAQEPGSVMKPLTLAIALKANEELRRRGQPELFHPSEMIDTSDENFPGRTKPLKDISPYHYLNMDMALQKSSNIYFARLAERIIERLGNEWYRNALHDIFGFGEKTGIELPAESRGVLPTPGKKHPNGKLAWSTPTPFSLAIGHNIQVTALQLLRAYSLLANGGYLVQPTLLRKIVKTQDDGQEQLLLNNLRIGRLHTFPQILDSQTTKRVVKAMKYVMQPRGSGRRGEIPGYTEAGKSGSAIKAHEGVYLEKKYVSSFIGFTPVENPIFVLLVTLDEPEYGNIPGIGRNHLGGVCAAPVFRQIATRSLEYLGIPPDDPFGYPPGDPRYDPEKADWIKEAHLLQENMQKWNNKP